MVLCVVGLIALPIFAVMGIFSVRYRKLAMDALECIFKTATFRKCHTGLDTKVKSHITGSILKVSPLLAKFVSKHFVFFSWVTFILFWGSLAMVPSGVGSVMNYIEYGTCYAPEESGAMCIFDPTGEETGCSDVDIDSSIFDINNVVIPEKDKIHPIRGDVNAPITIIEFGCYTCENTVKAEPILAEVLEAYDGQVNLQFRSFVIPNHEFSSVSAHAAECANVLGNYWDYHDRVFELEEVTNSSLYSIAEDVGFDMEAFGNCMNNPLVQSEIDADMIAGISAGLTGTPTFFIGDEKIVGVKPFKTFKNIIDKELERLD